MNVKVLNISLPAKLVAIIDREAALQFSPRSEYIKTAVIIRLRADGVWQDHEPPETENTLEALNKARRAHLKSSMVNKRLRSINPNDD